MISSCTTIKQWINGPTPTIAVIPDTALCTIDAKTMEENYMTLKDFFEPDDIVNEYDNRVISFTYEQMMDNLEYLIVEGRKRNINKEELGFRVYIAAKAGDEFLLPGEVDSIKGDTKSIKNGGGTYYTTVFFVATEKVGSEDANLYENIYEIPALDYGGSRRPPIKYESNQPCLIPGHNH
jgi:hypothetical protein